MCQCWRPPEKRAERGRAIVLASTSSPPQAPGDPRWTDPLLGCSSCRMGSEVRHEVSGAAPPALPPFHGASATSKQRGPGHVQRKANRKHMVFREPMHHSQSDRLALRTDPSACSFKHSCSSDKVLLRGLRPPASGGRAAQKTGTSASSGLIPPHEPRQQPSAASLFPGCPPASLSQWVPNQLIFPSWLSCCC